jgi:hypothetical protein
MTRLSIDRRDFLRTGALATGARPAAEIQAEGRRRAATPAADRAVQVRPEATLEEIAAEPDKVPLPQ